MGNSRHFDFMEIKKDSITFPLFTKSTLYTHLFKLVFSLFAKASQTEC